jgi:hypothetical protein
MADDLDHIADEAGLIASLPKNDRRRELGEKHAQSCAPCRQALREGDRLMAMLRRELSPSPSVPMSTMPMSTTTGEPVGRAARSAIEIEGKAPEAASRRLAWVTVGAAAVAWLFQLMVGGGFELDVDCAAVSLGVLTIAIGSITLIRKRPRLAIAVAVATSGLLAYVSGTAAGFEPGIGIRCTFRELWGTGIMWTIVMVAGRRTGVTFNRWNATAVAAAGALATHAGQHLACKVPHSEAHLLVFHFGGVVLAILLGAASFRVWPAMPART